MKNLLATALISIIVLSPFIFATSPTPAPYHQFFVSGVIERPSGGPKGNFTVVMLAKHPQRTGSNEFEILRSSGRQDDRPVALTDSTGNFYLVASSDDRPDSIVTGVVAPEHPTALGQKIAVSQLQATPYVVVQNYDYDDPGGCNGCQTTPRTQRVTTHYTYNVPAQSISITY